MHSLYVFKFMFFIDFLFSNYQSNFCQNFRGGQNWSDMLVKFLPGQLWEVLGESLRLHPIELPFPEGETSLYFDYKTNKMKRKSLL